MIEEMLSRLPDGWREVVSLLAAPVAWVPRLQQTLVEFFAESASPWATAGKLVLLLFPAMLGMVAIWCTQLSLYTLPFRSSRGRFISLILLAWWDAARVVWLYWMGLLRLVAVSAGWLLSLAHLAVRLVAGLIRHVAGAPLAVTSLVTRSYLQPGVPWVAFAMLILWCALEAAVFAYTLYPSVAEVLADLVGADEVPALTSPVLYVLLLMLILGSFACVQALVDAARTRTFRFLAQIILVELFVMFFEVMFLYRELVDSLTPWIAQETGVRMGLASTLLLAAFGWIGVRGMTWFLFGQYGTPPLLAFIARQPIGEAGGSSLAAVGGDPRAWWRPGLEDFRREIAWLHERGEQLLEYLALPVLHLLGAALNFATILTTGRPVFSLPFRSLKEVTETRELLGGLSLQPRKQASL
ncbi:MAG: hypothetical protein K6T92_09995 [Candidatus Rokubacteria bacterium]|nr:hypothetical protein [Candidatus Rokubacteria bacterium]